MKCKVKRRVEKDNEEHEKVDNFLYKLLKGVLINIWNLGALLNLSAKITIILDKMFLDRG